VPTTATQYLTSLTSLYTPTATEFDAARSHRASIENRLDYSLGLHEMFETGSLKHGTGVWGYSDADFIAALKGVRPDSPWTALNKVKDTLKERFSATEIVIRRPAVVCRFSDATVEVVPAYPAATGGGYWIADPRDGWMKTHPKDHNSYVNDANKKHSGAAKKLARQAKVWKYKRSVPVSSCYLEMRAAKYAKGEDSYFAVLDLYLFLNGLLGHSLASMNDPTGLGSRFNATSSDSNHEDAISKLETAVTRAGKAKDLASDEKHEDAIYYLKLLFNQ